MILAASDQAAGPAPSYPPAELAALRDIADRVARQAGRALATDPINGLVFHPPGLAALRALVWAAYLGEVPAERVGKAVFPGLDWSSLVADHPEGVHAQQVAAYVRWFEALRLNLPRYQEPRQAERLAA